jgi:type 2 lantibiotic biosynthesis protein LanM
MFNKGVYDSFTNKIVNEYSNLISDEFIVRAKENHYAFFKSIVSRYLVVNFQDTYGQKIEKPISNFYLSKYISEFNLDEHPIFKKNIDFKMDLYHNFILKILKNANNDKELLTSSDKKLQNIEVDLGDSHNGGESVAIVSFDDEIWVYKPKKLKKDEFYFSCLKSLNGALGIKYNYPVIIVKNDYSWQSYIEHLECFDKSMIERYYYSLGVQTFLLYVFNANDMHFENLIANGEFPVFIDLETLLQSTIHFQDENIKNDFTNNHVLNTLLFDISDNESIMDFIGGTTNRKGQPKYKISILNEDNDSISIVDSVDLYKSTTPNIPKDKEGNAVEIFEKKDIYIKGFKDSYKYIQDNPSMILNILKEYEDLNVRVVLRPTTVYSNYIEFFKQMENEDDPEILSILQNSIPFYKNNEKIAKYEMNSLKHFDVPYFHVGIDSLTLMSGDNSLHVFDFFKDTPRENLTHKLSILNKKDLKRQTYLLKLAIDSYRENSCSEKGTVLKKRDTESSIQNEMHLLYEYVDTEHPIFNIQLNKEGSTAITPITYDIYFGLSGIALLFLKYYKLEGKYIYKLKFEDLHNTIYILWKSDISNNFSAFHGRFSYFKYIYILNEFFDFHINIDFELKETLEDYLDFIENIDSYSIDYIGGLSGVLSLLIDFYNSMTSYSYLEKYIKLLFSKLLTNSVQKNGITLWKSDLNDNYMQPGLAHGTSGIILSLSKYNNCFPDNLISEKIEKMLRFENSEIDTINNRAWCNGFSGILLVRSIMPKYNLLNEDLKIEELTTNLKKLVSSNLNNKSVCHGDSGDSLILKVLNVNVNFEYILSYEWSSGFIYPNENIGFFLGKTGQLFNLITNNEDSKLISKILT